MRTVKGAGTALEKRFAKVLGEPGFDNKEKLVNDLFGKPDFANLDKHVAIFLDSCF